MISEPKRYAEKVWTFRKSYVISATFHILPQWFDALKKGVTHKFAPRDRDYESEAEALADLSQAIKQG